MNAVDDQIRNTGISYTISPTFGGSSPFKEVWPSSVGNYFIICLFTLIWLQIFCSRCRKGSAEVLVNFDDLYPSEALSVDKSEKVESDQKGSFGNIQICGKEVPRGYWVCSLLMLFCFAFFSCFLLTWDISSWENTFSVSDPCFGYKLACLNLW